jgi:hypothetical protein
MELDILKDAWASHNKKLEKNLKLNEDLLRRMNLDNAKKEMNKPLVMEMVNMSFMFVVTAYVLALSFRMLEDSMFSIPGFISLLFGGGFVAMGLIRIKRMLNLDYDNSTIIELQKKLAETKVLVLRFRKLEYLLMPFYAIALAPILLKGLLDQNIYSMLQHTYMQVIVSIGVVVIILLTNWSNKYFYDRKMKSAQQSLSEIIKYEKDDESII